MHGWQRKTSIIGLVIAAVAIGLPAIAFADRTPSNDKTFQYAIGLWGICRTRRCRPIPGFRTS